MIVVIVEGLVDIFISFLRVAFGALEFYNLPTHLIGTLSSVIVYGNWVIGLDLLAVFVTSVVFWWSFHLSIGIIVWVWDKLPLT